MASVVFGKMKKHEKNIERINEYRRQVRNAFTAYLLAAQERAKEADITLYFSNPFEGWIPNLTIEGDKITEHRDKYENPRDVLSELPAKEYILKENKSGEFNYTVAKKAVKQIERIFKREGVKKITRDMVLEVLENVSLN
nr:hypothetical protein [Nanoarchaeum sp.]